MDTYTFLRQFADSWFLLAMFLFLWFVVIIVMAFGDAYKITTSNQLLLTLAGGLLPFIFKEVLKPSNPNMDLNSYTIDGKIHEIIQEYHQTWPVAELAFKPKLQSNVATRDKNLPNIHLGPLEYQHMADDSATLLSRSTADGEQFAITGINTNTQNIDLEIFIHP